MADHSGYNFVRICISNPLTYLEYFNQYVMLTNLSTNVKFAEKCVCAAYLQDSCVVYIHFSQADVRTPKYVAHTYFSANFTYSERFVSITYQYICEQIISTAVCRDST